MYSKTILPVFTDKCFSHASHVTQGKDKYQEDEQPPSVEEAQFKAI